MILSGKTVTIVIFIVNMQCIYSENHNVESRYAEYRYADCTNAEDH